MKTVMSSGASGGVADALLVPCSRRENGPGERGEGLREVGPALTGCLAEGVEEQM